MRLGLRIGVKNKLKHVVQLKGVPRAKTDLVRLRMAAEAVCECTIWRAQGPNVSKLVRGEGAAGSLH